MTNTRRILIVDDDSELREALVEQLALHEEFESIAVDNGTKGVQTAKAGQIDLVIMDVGLPDVDGREAVRILRKYQAAEVINPAVHFGVSGAGPRAWFGWPDVPQLDKLVTEWVRATDQTKRLQLGDEIQKVALNEVTYVPWGEWVQPTAFRRNVQGVLKFGAPIFWNAKVT
jgi:CheY-like chemotaxis protein